MIVDEQRPWELIVIQPFRTLFLSLSSLVPHSLSTPTPLTSRQALSPSHSSRSMHSILKGRKSFWESPIEIENVHQAQPLPLPLLPLLLLLLLLLLLPNQHLAVPDGVEEVAAVAHGESGKRGRRKRRWRRRRRRGEKWAKLERDSRRRRRLSSRLRQKKTVTEKEKGKENEKTWKKEAQRYEQLPYSTLNSFSAHPFLLASSGEIDL